MNNGSRAYYNEIDPYAAQWLRNLIAAGHIAPGDVDERSIVDVHPDDLRGYTQCHFFAGIGGWSYAARLAGWPDWKPIWTGSCPCQPFSVAANAQGAAGYSDDRDLWPDFFRLIQKCGPTVVAGEQVASAIKWGWWDRASMDMETANYACAPAILRADACGAAHERKRLYWIADANSERWKMPEQKGRFSCGREEAVAVPCNDFAHARRAVDGDYSDLLPHDGISIGVERLRAHGYGNAIVPQVAAQFLKAYLDLDNSPTARYTATTEG